MAQECLHNVYCSRRGRLSSLLCSRSASCAWCHHCKVSHLLVPSLMPSIKSITCCSGKPRAGMFLISGSSKFLRHLLAKKCLVLDFTTVWTSDSVCDSEGAGIFRLHQKAWWSMVDGVHDCMPRCARLSHSPDALEICEQGVDSSSAGLEGDQNRRPADWQIHPTTALHPSVSTGGSRTYSRIIVR